MWVEIVVARSAYPIVGAVIDIPESIGKKLVDSGLAILSDGKQKTETKKQEKVIEIEKVEPTEEG